ncbi:MAG TPA: hypothetical protein PLY45_02150, partial [bacterium]|nr:hypothetical protein [bacterium]
ERPAFDSLKSLARRFATHATHSKEPKKKSDFLLVYERSPTLKSIPEETLRDEAELMAFLLARRDRIAAENVEAAGVENPGSIPPAELSSRYTVSDLVRALFAAGVIKEDGRTYGILKGAAEPLDYFVKNREKLEREVRRLLSIDPDGPWHIYAKKGLFVKPGAKAPALLEGKEIDAVVKWGNWVLTDPEVSLRSIFRGDEIAYSVITNHRELLALASPETLDRFENAAWIAPHYPADSRREAVAALGRLIAELENLPDLDPKLKAEAESWLSWLKKLHSWNADAAAESMTAKPQPGPLSGTGAPVKTADEGSAPVEAAPPEAGVQRTAAQPADAAPEEVNPTFSELFSLALAPALRFVSGLLGVELPGSAKLTAAKVFSAAGLVGAGGRLADAGPEKFRKLAELASRHPGGIPAMLSEMGEVFFLADEARGVGQSPSLRFLLDRGAAATRKDEDDRELTLLYLKHLSAAIEAGPDAASMTLILEALRFERTVVVANVARLAGASLVKSAAAEAGFPDGGGVPWQGHPLFATPSERRKDLPDPASKPGIVRISTHDGSLLFSREEVDPLTGNPVVVISGDPEILAEMAERLSASSGGAALPDADDAIFPLNNAMEFLAGAATRQLFPSESGAFFESAIDFANATSLEARVDEEKMMPEIVFSASPADVGAVRRFHGLKEESPLDPAFVPQAWVSAVELYVGGKPFDRMILESSGADTASIRRAFENVAMHGTPETAVAVGMMLAPGGGSSHVKVPGLWNSGAGVAVTPEGKIDRIVIRLSPDGFGGDGRFFSQVGDVDFTGTIADNEIRWRAESPAMPLKTKAEIALLVDSLFMGKQRFGPWGRSGEEVGRQGAGGKVGAGQRDPSSRGGE